MPELKVFIQNNIYNRFYKEVERVGEALFEYIETESVMAEIEKVNLSNKSSQDVQDILLKKAVELGFQSEKRGLFSDISNSNLRPDYYKRIETTGIIIEVERGKTIMNNMDMLDFWKCHIFKVANHLFLFVPNELKHNLNSEPNNCFQKVSSRMAPFFEEGNYTNVHSLWLFGY